MRILLSLIVLVVIARESRAQDYNAVTFNPVSWPVSQVVYRGDGTYFAPAANIRGNCKADVSGADAVPGSTGDVFVAAINQQQYDRSWACGACAYVIGPNANITVRLIDMCAEKVPGLPDCLPGNLDFSNEAFSILTNGRMILGRVKITWFLTPCPISGNLQYRVMYGSNEWWTAIQILNYRVPLRSVEFRLTDGSWFNVGRLSYNYWLKSTGMGLGNYFFRVTSVTGESFIDGPFQLSPGVIQYGARQFSANGQTATATPSLGPTRTQTATRSSSRTPSVTPSRASSPSPSGAPTLLPSATPLPPIATPLPPIATPLPPNATPLPPSASPLPPSVTPLPPSATYLAPSATPLPPTAIRTLTPVQTTSTCSVRYSFGSIWTGGATVNVDIITTVPLSSWSLSYSLPPGQSISQSWNCGLSVSGQQVTARNAGWNGNIGAAGTVSFGYNVNRPTGDPPARPTSFTLNTVVCNVL